MLRTEDTQLTPAGDVFSKVVLTDYTHVAPSGVVVAQPYFFFMLYKVRLVVLHGCLEGLKCNKVTEVYGDKRKVWSISAIVPGAKYAHEIY